MINKKFIQSLKKSHDVQNSERRQIISLANIVLHDSKRVIFSLHRDNPEKAAISLKEIETILKKLEKKFGTKRLNEEGAYRAGAEEYVEAKMFYLLTTGKKIDKILGLVKGNTIRARHIGRDIAAGFKTIIGGEIKSYTEMTTQAREEAFNRMINEAYEKGADAVISIVGILAVVTVVCDRSRVGDTFDTIRNGAINGYCK